MLEIFLLYIIVLCSSLIIIYIRVEDIEYKWDHLSKESKIKILTDSSIGIFINKSRLRVDKEIFDYYMSNRKELSNIELFITIVFLFGLIRNLLNIIKDYKSICATLNNQLKNGTT